MIKNNRISWIDTLKGIGIYLIYVVHLPNNVGKFNMFFMLFAVPLFFFSGGLTDRLSTITSYKDFVIKKAKQILIPYFVFGVLTGVVRLIIIPDTQLGDIIVWGKELIIARRNDLFAPSLWFLPCYFVLVCIYRALKTLIKNNKLLLIACLVISIIARYTIDGPVVPWGIDYAMRYLAYYAIGVNVYPLVERMKSGNISIINKIIFSFITLSAFSLLLINYLYGIGYIPSLLGITLTHPGKVAETIYMTVVGLYCVTIVSIILSRLNFFAAIGRVSLLLCCGESITKLITPVIFEVFGLTLHYESPMQGLLCCALFIIIAYYFIALPVEKYFPEAVGKINIKKYGDSKYERT